jgi:hypothetical protein
MVMRILLIIAFVWILLHTFKVSRDVYEPVSDPQALQNILDTLDSDTLKPIEVIQRTPEDKMRVMFFDTDTYAGKLMDFDVTTQMPTLVNPILTSDIIPMKKTL